MISSVTQRIEKYYCQLSDSLTIYKGLTSNFSDNRSTCDACTAIFVFLLSLEVLFYSFKKLVLYIILLKGFLLIIILTLTFHLFRSSMYLLGHCSMV